MLDRNQSVASVVLDHSECAEVFLRHSIDFCCHGELSIELAAQRRALDPDVLLDQLARVIAQRNAQRRPDPRELSTSRLIAHIVSVHHAYLRTALPFVKPLAAKVGRVHGQHNPNLRVLDAAVTELSETLLAHLDEEERELFPLLIAGETNRTELAKRLDDMAGEHRLVGELLGQVRAASDDFSVPDWACNSYRTLFSELRQLESDVSVHVHLENHVLKPRFAQS